MIGYLLSPERRAEIMKKLLAVCALVCLAALVLGVGVASGQSAGSILAWGYNAHGVCDVPAPNTDFVAVTGRHMHSLGLMSDGTIVAWGDNLYGVCDVPAPNADFVAVASGYYHSLGLKSDGTIAAWGRNAEDQCDVPAPNAGFVAVAAGGYHGLGLKSDGTIVTWGFNGQGQCDVPAPNADFVAVAAGVYHGLGLKSDGTIVAWGFNGQGQCDVPEPNADFVAVAGGKYHSLGLKSDGTIAAWGRNAEGQCDVPLPNAGFLAVAAGYGHSLGLKSDGTVVAWGYNSYGQCDVPAPNGGFVALAGGYCHSLVVRTADQGTTPEATVDFHPSTLNCGSHGRFVTCYIELPEGYDPADIDISTVVLNDELPALIHPTGVGDEDNDGIPDRMVKFDRAHFVELLPLGEYVEVAVSCELNDETPFAGADSVRVICKDGLRGTIAGTSPPALRVSPGRDGSPAVISYYVFVGSPVRLRVYDIGGRLIRTLVDGEASRNSCDVVWDGRADGGHRVGAGVYFLRLEAGGEVRTEKVAVVR
jgi:hypothetical protein